MGASVWQVWFWAIFCYCCLVTKSCPTLCKPMDCNPPGSSIHGIFWAKILERVAISFSKGSSWPRDQSHVPCPSRWILCCWAGGKALAVFYTQAEEGHHWARNILLICHWWKHVTWPCLGARVAGKCSFWLGSHIWGQLYTMEREAWILISATFSFYWWGNWGPERLIDLSKGTQKISNRNHLNQIFWLQVSYSLISQTTVTLFYGDTFI